MSENLKEIEQEIGAMRKSADKAVGEAESKFDSLLSDETIHYGRIKGIVRDHMVAHHHDGRYTASGLLHDIKTEIINRDEEKP